MMLVLQRVACCDTFFSAFMLFFLTFSRFTNIVSLIRYNKRKERPPTIVVALSSHNKSAVVKLFITIMIRNFTILCKLNLKNISDSKLFSDSLASFCPSKAVCPVCGAKGCLSYHASYSRYLIGMDKGSLFSLKVSIPRFICSSCRHTHAILPDVLIPYGSYSLTFILSVLKDYFAGASKVIFICTKYQISPSTLYAWKKLFFIHKELWLGMLVDSIEKPLKFLNGLFHLDSTSVFTEAFFQQCAFSFMQQLPKTSFSHLP